MTNMESKKLTLLLTSAGGLTGIFLSKHFKETSNYRIIAVDMSEYNPLKKWVDEFYKVPSIKDDRFLPIVKEIISNESVDALIPVTSYDVDYFSKTEIQSELKGVGILTMDYKDHSTLHDKASCYHFLNNIGILTPKIYTSIEDAHYPCVIKPTKSSGSKDTVIIHDHIECGYWKSRIINSIIVQYLDGKEYTVDCLFNKKGDCLGANVRERVKIANGGATITRNDYSIKIENIIKKLEKTHIIKGPVNFQFKVLPNNDICVFDFNTRLASGGLPLTIKSGFDIPNILVKLLLGEKVERWELNSKNDGLTMIRYFDEYYVGDTNE